MAVQHTGAQAGDLSKLPVSLRNPDKVTEEQLALLWADFQRLSACGATLAEDAMRYAVDGAGSAVVGAVRQATDAGRQLELTACNAHGFILDAGGLARRQLFNDPTLPVTVLNRMLEIYEAASHTSGPRRMSGCKLPDWLDILLTEASGFKPAVWTSDGVRCQVAASTVEALAIARSAPRDLLLQAGLAIDPATIRFSTRLSLVAANPAMAGQIAAHADTVRAALEKADVAGRALILKIFEESAADVAPFAAEVVAFAVGPSKTLQKAADNFVRKLGPKALPALREKAQSGPTESRRLAIHWIWQLEGRESESFLRSLLEAPVAKAVKPFIEELVTGAAATGAQSSEEPAPLPPLPKLSRECPLSPSARAQAIAALRKAIDAGIRIMSNHPHATPRTPPSDDDLERAIRYLERGDPADRAPFSGFGGWIVDPGLKLATHPEITLLHVVRLAGLIGQNNNYARNHHTQALAMRYFATHPSSATLRDLAVAMVAAGRDEKDLGHLMLIENAWHGSELLRLPAEAIWPYFAEHPELIEEAWNYKDPYGFQSDARRRAIFKVLGAFPSMPARYIRLLWDIALTGNKKERPLAQSALNAVPGKEERIIAALASGRAEQRAVAADWLAQLKHAPAIPALRKALAAEKQDLAAGGMMAALEALGVPLEEFISMEGLLKEAKALVGKGIPKDIEWFPFDRLPKVHWAHNNRAVPREILIWMILQSYKLSNPEPGPRLRQYTRRFVTADAEALGQFVLEAWLAQDTIPPTHAQADAYAQKQVAQLTQLTQAYPQYAPPGNANSWYQSAYAAAMGTPISSAIAQKGILAIAGACCGRAAAGPVEKFVKTYYGNRVHQCRALISMLSWIEHPSAVQVLLSVATRFRTASIRKEAETRVNELAERKNWTRDELADRSIPTAGFETDLTLLLDYGPRVLKARFTPELSIQLFADDEKPLKALPDPRQTDDAAKAAAAKKQLSASRKELSSVVKLQKERLYEAMCTQRTWPWSDWHSFLYGHPIVRSLCHRLVWAIRDGDASVTTFRPLADRSFTDAADEPVTIPPDAVVCLAHESVCPAGTGAAWQTHLSDYEIEPLFVQFGKPSVPLSTEKLTETTIDEFKGHMTEAFKLRGRLTKAGFTRGPTGDGGWFHTYIKHFPSLGLRATIEFSGNGLPEENRNVAMVSLSFSRPSQESQGYMGEEGSGVPLGDVPSVLLSECYFDYRAAAMDGPGFDADWEKKAY